MATRTKTPEQRAAWAVYMRDYRRRNYEHVRELERESVERRILRKAEEMLRERAGDLDGGNYGQRD